MPRNSSGVYTLPVAAYVAGTTIKSADMNSNLSDVGTALTQSLATTGVSSMSGPVKLAAGSIGSPSLTLASDVTTGWYNSAAGAWTFVSTGTAIITLGPSAVIATNMTVTNLTVTGSFSVAANRLVGEVVDYCGTSAPSLWLLAFGQAISRTTYASLFSVIGTNFGTGDGVTTFNAPDYRGRVGVGKDDMGGSAAGRVTVAESSMNGAILGVSGGLQSVNLTIAQIPSHNHTISDPTHSHTTTHATGTFSAAPGGANTFGGDNSGTTALAATGVTTVVTGSGATHLNMQPTLIVNKIIYVAV